MINGGREGERDRERGGEGEGETAVIVLKTIQKYIIG